MIAANKTPQAAVNAPQARRMSLCIALYPGRAKADPEPRKYRLFGHRLEKNFTARFEHRMHFSVPFLSKIETGLKPFFQTCFTLPPAAETI